uniref:nucleoside hydrolase n=1 Tax=Ningiella ruwaisensis TaxID=2364274 RepID=UPI00109F2264|nr:nucleoside hydrolase [Ningiella ruwaisensis]
MINRRRFLAGAVACISSASALAQISQKNSQIGATQTTAISSNKPTAPTVLCTDIGSDIDDTWALAHILRVPQLDFKMVLTETGEAEYRALVTAKMLEAARRTDVEIALGRDFGVMRDEHRHQGPWVKNYDLEQFPGTIHKEGIDAFIRLIKSSVVPVKVIAVGPAPSLAEALKRAPEIAQNCEFYGMYGSFDFGYGGNPQISAETNVRVDVNAFRTLMTANWKSAVITPLDTCGLVHLKGENYYKIWSATDDDLLRSVIENYCIWAPRVPWMECDFFATASSTLFDDVAVYMAYDGSLLDYETIRFSVDDKGYTLRDENGPYSCKVAIRWKSLEKFEDFLTQQLLSKEMA